MGLLNLTPEQLIANFITLLIGMTVHEFAHAWVADNMGDPTPRAAGRLTLNPFVNINWIGFAMFAILGFGMLGSTPISPSRMRYPRWGGIAALAAGPLANLMLAAASAIILTAAMPMFASGSLPMIVFTILYTMVYLNVILCVFNFLPLYPLDGWRVVEALLPRAASNWWSNNWQPSYFLFIGLILFSFLPSSTGLPNVLGTIIGEPATFITSRLIGF